MPSGSPRLRRGGGTLVSSCTQEVGDTRGRKGEEASGAEDRDGKTGAFLWPELKIETARLVRSDGLVFFNPRDCSFPFHSGLSQDIE